MIPSRSWDARPTFFTGEAPPGHGALDFVERDRAQSGKRLPVASASIKAPTILGYLSEQGREVRAGNFPVAYLPFPVEGRMVSVGAVPPGSEFVHRGTGDRGYKLARRSRPITRQLDLHEALKHLGTASGARSGANTLTLRR